MNSLRPAAKLYLTAVALAALGVTVAALADATPPGRDRAALALALTGAMAVAWRFPLPLVAGTKLPLDTAVLVAAILLFEPGVALLIAGTGTLVAHILRRQSWDQAVFNTAQVVLMAAVGGVLLAGTGWQVDHLRLDQPESTLPILVAAAAMYLLNVLAVATILALQAREPFPRAWLRVVEDAVRGGGRVEGLAHLAQVGLGVLAAGLADTRSWMLALLLLPAGAVYQALGHHVRLRLRAEQRLVHQAFHDHLTGLPNRALLLDRLDQALGRAAGREGAVAVLFLDLDDFKFVNDSLGHTAGDRLLAAVGDRLRACVPPPDTIARLGGDEFVVLLADLADPRVAEGVAARIDAALDASFALGDHEVAVTASVGMALNRPEHESSIDLLRDADVALRHAKVQGRAHSVVYVPAMGAALAERVALRAELRRAMAAGELRLAYQPLVELATGRVEAVEALVRWQHPVRGLLAAGEFVPLAEETGLIGVVGAWVLEEACRQGRSWQERYLAPPVVDVNLSARQFQRPKLVEEVARALRASGLEPGYLRLEITESVVMPHGDAAVVTLRQLKGLGVQLALDDFGTGHSSLGYLRRFPLDLLKIDKAFIVGLGRDAGDVAIVQAVIGLAHTLGLRVVAEGVETGEQLARLHELGCELGQGYLFGHPAPDEAITALLDKVSYATSSWTRQTS